ncbi:MAG: hypothetical protein Q8O43_08965 [Dehalococcoidia bacterium]|nr:hypothetical protein [Dehalococcoidia bacterium]
MSSDTAKLLDATFREWVQDQDPVRARIAVFEKVRDIPYAVIPELIDARRYTKILTLRRGSCTPKHFLLADMFRRLGLLTLFTVYPFRWGERSEILENYPPLLKELADKQPVGYHLACKVEIEGRLVLVDATLDKPLSKLELLPVNLSWDGFSDTLLPMTPIGEEITFHPLEAHVMKPVITPEALIFYDFLNRCMDEVRKNGTNLSFQPRIIVRGKLRLESSV